MMNKNLIRPQQQHVPYKYNCPQTWQVALCMCFLSVFFLSGVMVGCYLGVVHRCKQQHKEDASSNKIKLQPDTRYNDQIPFIEILNDHEHILLLVENSRIKYSLACKKERLDDLLDDNLSHFEKLLTAMHLYETKYHYYPVVATGQNITLHFESPAMSEVFDYTQNIHLLKASTSLPFKTEVMLKKDISKNDKSLEGIVVLMEFDAENIFQDIVELVERRAKGILLYSADCLTQPPHANLFTDLNSLFQDLTNIYPIHIQLLSCKAFDTLVSSLGGFEKSRNKNLDDLIKESTSKGAKMHVSVQKTVVTNHFTNIISTFYGSRDPDLIILVGASRCNVKGTSRWLKLLMAVTDSLFKNTHGRVWSPYRSMKFISWSKLGVYDFIKTYQEAWKHKVVVYLDLDDPDIDLQNTKSFTHQTSHFSSHASTIQLQVSSSLRPFVDTVVEQLTFNNPNTSPIQVISSDKDQAREIIAHILESSMGIPSIRISKMPRKLNTKIKRAGKKKSSEKMCTPDEMIMKFFTTTMLSKVDGEVLQISSHESMHEIVLFLEQYKSHKYEMETDETGEESIGDLIDTQIKDLLISCKRLSKLTQDFESTLQLFSQTFQSVYQVRKTNDLKLRVENDVRIIIYQLPSILSITNHKPNSNPSLLNSLFKQSSSAYHSYYNPTNTYSGVDFMYSKRFGDVSSQCKWDMDDMKIEKLLTSLAQINLKIQGLSRLTNIRE